MPDPVRIIINYNGVISWMGEDVTRNELDVNVRASDVFDFLRNPDRPEYDIIILDPPSFTKARGKVGDALRGYRDLHARAAKLLSKNGTIGTTICLTKLLMH